MSVELMHDIRTLEESCLNALPALQTVFDDGWILRYARGYTRRANSAQALYPHRQPLAEKIARCERFYRERGQPAVFKLTEAVYPTDLDARLEAMGYEDSAHTSVQLAPLSGIEKVDSVVIQQQLNDEWLRAYCQMNEVAPFVPEVMPVILRSVAPPAAYGSIIREGQIVAVGLAVADGPYMGLFDIVVDAAQRNQGLGKQLVQGLMAWGEAQGSHHAYLQVLSTNQPALRLYSKLGFGEAYRYWYRSKA
ncbi:MAG: GNAT family N-acetyltransferase [Anaerolineae bacterium]|nr:GNAT family N-acetyltransferase [Anaerolineae bacterium]